MQVHKITRFQLYCHVLILAQKPRALKIRAPTTTKPKRYFRVISCYNKAMQYLLVLGRQPEISLAELRALGVKIERTWTNASPANLARLHRPRHIYHLAFTDDAKVLRLKNRLGGTIKIARALAESPFDYLNNLDHHKLVFGLSDFNAINPREVGREALHLKERLVDNHSVRVIPNQTPVLTSATILKNGLLHPEKGRAELLKLNGRYFVTVHEQNITAYARRDQNRPARDARVGMLPPKLAQILINLCGDLPQGARILDPFCGTGVILQEAELMGYAAYGSDLSARMVDFSRQNLTWLEENWFLAPDLPKPVIEEGDATTHRWQSPIDGIATEIYLGPPLSRVPSEGQFRTLRSDARELVQQLLTNLAPQLATGTPVVLAAPAWLRPSGIYQGIIDRPSRRPARQKPTNTDKNTPKSPQQRQIPVQNANLPNFSVDFLAHLGYNQASNSVEPLIYHRDGQVVAREIIVLRKQ